MWATLVSDWEDNSVLRNFANVALPASADNNANFMLRFRIIWEQRYSDYGYVDDVAGKRDSHLTEETRKR